MKTFKDLTGETYTTNPRKKLDRFIETLPEEKLFFSNGEMRMEVKKDGYIAFGDYYVRYRNGGNQRYYDCETVEETIETIKKYI